MDESESLLLVLTTVATRADADALARAMVEQRLAACVHIEAIDSVYHWEGAVQTEPEFRLLLKTAPQRHAALLEALRAAHPYELPAIVSLPAQAGRAFATWVAEHSAG